MSSSKKSVVMVSSTVYGIEELLDRIYTLLTSFGYEVWMSHKGTMPVSSHLTAFENSIQAVEKCDLFLGIVTTNYGSGKDAGGISITHQELRKAIELNKRRWLLAHDHVVFARSLIKNLGYGNAVARGKLSLVKSSVLDDLRVIDMYEDAIRAGKPLRVRQGNWVQKFQSNEDASLFVVAQFSRYQEVDAFVTENFCQRPQVEDQIPRLEGES